MERQSIFLAGICIFHIANLIAGAAVGFKLAASLTVRSRGNVFRLLISSFVAAEAINFLWLCAFAEDIFGIRGQGLEVGRIHLVYIGPIFLAALASAVTASERKKTCVGLTLTYPILGAVAIVLF